MLQQWFNHRDLFLAPKDGQGAAGIADQKIMGTLQQWNDFGNGVGGFETTKGFQRIVRFGLVVTLQHPTNCLQIGAVERRMNGAENASGLLSYYGTRVGQ